MAADLTTDDSRRALARARGTVHEWYQRLAALNYARQWFWRRNRTPAGTVRCYEPLTRHGNDEMLAEMDAVCDSEDVIADVGANVGLYALALASDEPRRRLIAFEPDPAVADRFRANLSLNDLGDRVTLHTCALGETDGRRPFYRSSNPELSAFDRAAATRWGASVRDVRSIPVRRLDSLVFDLERREDDSGGDPLPPPDAIKIDVEGAAPSVLRGARRVLERHEPTLFVERHEDGLTDDVPVETTVLLEDAAYAVFERPGYWRCEPS